MVTVINYKERNKEDGTSFFVLEVQGDLEMVKSETTGQFYATAKKAYLPTTFDELTCKALIGGQIEGSVQKVSCEPYESVNKATGEVAVLRHRYQYQLEDFVKDKGSNASVASIGGGASFSGKFGGAFA